MNDSVVQLADLAMSLSALFMTVVSAGHSDFRTRASGDVEVTQVARFPLPLLCDVRQSGQGTELTKGVRR